MPELEPTVVPNASDNVYAGCLDNVDYGKGVVRITAIDLSNGSIMLSLPCRLPPQITNYIKHNCPGVKLEYSANDDATSMLSVTPFEDGEKVDPVLVLNCLNDFDDIDASTAIRGLTPRTPADPVSLGVKVTNDKLARKARMEKGLPVGFPFNYAADAAKRVRALLSGN